MTTPSIGIGVLSWRAHKTLTRALDSYAENGFLPMFDERLIYFSDMDDSDIALAQKYGWAHAGGLNEGIAGGMKRLGENLKSDYILLLQNDNPIVENADFAQNHIRRAVDMLAAGRADLARMRHRWMVGEGFVDVKKYLRYFPAHNVDPSFMPQDNHVSPADYPDGLAKKLRRALRPSKARRLCGRGIFIEQHPEKVHPSVVTREGDFLVIDSSGLNFSDQCLLISRKMWLEVFMPYVEAHPSSRQSNGFQAPEICINGPWWHNGHFKTLQGRGVFSHARFDGSFRPGHPAYQDN